VTTPLSNGLCTNSLHHPSSLSLLPLSHTLQQTP
jgi:hypothetical protein